MSIRHHPEARDDDTSSPSSSRALIDVDALVRQIYAARFQRGDRVRVLTVPAEWTGRTGTVRQIHPAGPWPVAVDLDPTDQQPAIRAHLVPDQAAHLQPGEWDPADEHFTADQPEGAP